MTLEVTKANNSITVREKNQALRTMVLDMFSYAVCNILSGMPIFSNAIEIRGGELEARALEDTYVVVTGFAKLFVNNEAKPLWKAVKVRKGDVLKIKAPPEKVAYFNLVGGLKISQNCVGESIQVSSVLQSYEKGDFEDIERESRALFLPQKYIPNQPSSVVDTKIICPFEEYIEKAPRAAVLSGKVFDREYLMRTSKIVDPSTFDNETAQMQMLYLKDESHLIAPLQNGNGGKMPMLGYVSPWSFDHLSRAPLKARIRVSAVLPSEYLRVEYEKYVSYLRHIERVIKAAREAARRGAVLLRIKVNNIPYDVWIEELD